MADSAIAVTAGSGTNVDTRTEGTNGNHRQVVVLGDPATNAGVAPVDATNGLAVQIIPALPAGTNAIGKLAANSGVDIGDVDVTTVTPGTDAAHLGKAEDAAHTSGDVGVMALAVRRDSLSAGGADGDYVTLNIDANGRLYVASSSAGDVAHDAADSGSPIKIGHKAVAHGTNPTAVAAGDRTDSYANRAGIPFVIGGHPNVITRSATIDDADGAQTNASLLTVSAGNKIVITSISATCASSNSGAVAVRIGFGTATLGAASESGTDGILLEGKFPAGGGHQRGNGAGILGIGADNEDLRITCDDPAGGSLFVTFSYYTVES